MKVYIGLKKDKDRWKYGLTIYGKRGIILYSTFKFERVLENKFDNYLSMLHWAINKVKVKIQNKGLSDSDDIQFFISSQLVYNWIQLGYAVDPYIVKFSDFMLDLSFIPNDVYFICSKNVMSKVKFENSEKDELIKVTDMFK